MSHQRPTMLDVAALAGVGLTTVSRVVNGKPRSEPGNHRSRSGGDRAARLPPRRSRVEPSPFRSEDRDHRTGSRGRRQPVHVGAPSRGRGFCQGARDARLRRELRRGRRVASASSSAHFAPAGWTASSSCRPGPDHSYLLPELRVGTAIVFVDRPPRFLDADSVTSDDHGGTFMAVSHLVERGHERIAYLGADLAIATARRASPGVQGRTRSARARLRVGDRSYGSS